MACVRPNLFVDREAIVARYRKADEDQAMADSMALLAAIYTGETKLIIHVTTAERSDTGTTFCDKHGEVSGYFN